MDSEEQAIRLIACLTSSQGKPGHHTRKFKYNLWDRLAGEVTYFMVFSQHFPNLHYFKIRDTSSTYNSQLIHTRADSGWKKIQYISGPSLSDIPHIITQYNTCLLAYRDSLTRLDIYDDHTFDPIQ